MPGPARGQDLRFKGECENKCQALAFFTDDLQIAPQHIDPFIDRHQTYPQDIFLAVQGLLAASAAIVGDRKIDFSGMPLDAHADFGGFAILLECS